MHCHDLKELLREWGRLRVGLQVGKKEEVQMLELISTGDDVYIELLCATSHLRELISIRIAHTRQNVQW